MSGKSQKQKYGEFRVFVEWRRRGKWVIRPEFVPSVAAWLLMIGKKYERMAQGMRDRLAIVTVPGLKQSIDTVEVCCKNIQLLLDSLTDHFGNEDWQAAVKDICELMGIRPSSSPMEEVPAGQFAHLISEPIYATDESGGDEVVQLRTGAGEGGAEFTELDRGTRSGGTDAGHVPEPQEPHHRADSEPRADGGEESNRRKRSRKGNDRRGKKRR